MSIGTTANEPLIFLASVYFLSFARMNLRFCFALCLIDIFIGDNIISKNNLISKLRANYTHCD